MVNACVVRSLFGKSAVNCFSLDSVFLSLRNSKAIHYCFTSNLSQVQRCLEHRDSNFGVNIDGVVYILDKRVDVLDSIQKISTCNIVYNRSLCVLQFNIQVKYQLSIVIFSSPEPENLTQQRYYWLPWLSYWRIVWLTDMSEGLLEESMWSLA